MKVIVDDLYSQITFSSSAGGVLLYGDERKEKLAGVLAAILPHKIPY
jgi:hypothetical protein